MNKTTTAQDVVNYLKSLEMKINSSEFVRVTSEKDTMTKEEALKFTSIGVIMTSLTNRIEEVEQGLEYLISEGIING